MFLLVPSHPGCPGENPESCKIVVLCVYVSSFGDTFIFYKLCHRDINIAHGSHADLRKNCTTQKHLNAASAAKLQLSLLFAGADRSVEVTCTELLFSSFLIEHSMPL